MSKNQKSNIQPEFNPEMPRVLLASDVKSNSYTIRQSPTRNLKNPLRRKPKGMCGAVSLFLDIQSSFSKTRLRMLASSRSKSSVALFVKTILMTIRALLADMRISASRSQGYKQRRAFFHAMIAQAAFEKSFSPLNHSRDLVTVPVRPQEPLIGRMYLIFYRKA
jgi:hypothetical protein